LGKIRYPVAVVYGFVLGGFSSFCRALFGELVPPGFEAAFYSLYAITDKGSSVFGPAIVGAITDATGEIRPVSNHSRAYLCHSVYQKL
jgi:UMF1 family MFS transporter